MSTLIISIRSQAYICNVRSLCSISCGAFKTSLKNTTMILLAEDYGNLDSCEYVLSSDQSIAIRPFFFDRPIGTSKVV